MIDIGPDAEFGVYVFTVGGQRFHGRSYRFYETDQKIRILYNPRHPEKNRPEGDRVDLTYSLVIPFFLCRDLGWLAVLKGSARAFLKAYTIKRGLSESEAACDSSGSSPGEPRRRSRSWRR